MIRSLFALPLLLLIVIGAAAQEALPVIQATQGLVSVRVGKEVHHNAWGIAPEAKPDVYQASIKGREALVAFLTDVDSIGFRVKPGESYRFYILLNGKDSALTEIQGVKFTEPARFSKKYIRTHTGKTLTEIPEVYELLNIAFALTPTYKKEQWAVSKGTDYYDDVLQYFDRYSNHPTVLLLDSLLARNLFFVLKMDGYAFDMDRRGRIVPGKVYDRVSWGQENTLRPYIAALQAFADDSGFRAFFRAHQPYYDRQIAAYRDSIGTGQMVEWLNGHFPGTSYNAFKIIWSPLVGGNQSANWFEDNGFKEAHAHVNFPYAHYEWFRGDSPASTLLRRGNIVFTEINHSFINPEAEKPEHAALINRALADLRPWAAEGSTAQYYGNPMACFNEYMNWGLVSLRYADAAPAGELEAMLRQNEEMMVNGRGFTRFAEFNRFLVDLYRQRPAGATIASLYPAIIAWFAAQT